MSDTIEPLQHTFVKEVMDGEKNTLFNLVEAFGSAVHILLPEIFQENVHSFKRVFEQYRLKYGIMYAAKANKGKSFLEVCSKTGIGTDVSSIFELRSSLSHGVSGMNIGISGPTKTDTFLLLAIQNNALISLDSHDELERLIIFIKKGFLQRKIKVLIRIGDIIDSESRFGFSIGQLDAVYKTLQEYSNSFDFQGFSFHLEGYSPDDRVRGIGKIYKEIEVARKKGFDCSIIDIGGGFTIPYLDDTGWEKFSKDSNQFYKKRSFKSFYPYSSENTKETFLEKILTSVVTEVGVSVHELLNSAGIGLLIEPGRALLDQAGFTLVKVRGNRLSMKGDNLVVVDANFNHLSEQWFNTDFIPGPIHIPSGITHKDSHEGFVASVAGNTCMENDILTWRKKQFSQKPQKNDLLAYMNTAGYQMDSNETDFHQLPIPNKVAMFRGPNNSIKWKKDSEFSQLDII